MSDWASGYVTDIDYTYGYYAELNPARIRLAFLNAGLAFPNIGSACELGFGQGLSTNIHAAASTTTWVGTDFNPSQAAFAQEMAAASGSTAKLYYQAFTEFCSRTDLPDFDYIALHGIWSWISDENRRVIVDFIGRKLKAGGVLYVSYNTLPGWAAFAPLRHLMSQHFEVMGATGTGTQKRLAEALEFASDLLASEPLYAHANPSMAARFEKVKKQDPNYLAHEYFNQHWKPIYFSEMADWLAPARVTFACSANYLDALDMINLKSEQQAFLKGIQNARFGQTVRDFMVNQQFRKDYWVKGARLLSPLEQMEGLNAHRIILASSREDVPLKITGALGEANMDEKVYNTILDAISDYKPLRLGDLARRIRSAECTEQAIIEATIVLSSSGHVMAVQDDHSIEQSQASSDKLNAYLSHKARSSEDIQHMSSPVTGGGIGIGQFGQLFLSAVKAGRKTPEECAEYTWGVYASQGKNLIKDGVTLVTPEDNLSELHIHAQSFHAKSLPVLRGLKII